MLSFIPVLACTVEAQTYQPAKVAYDLSASSAQEVNHLFDRIGLLQNFYDNNSFEASIVVVVHEGAIPLLAKRNAAVHKDLLQRAASLVLGEIIQYRVCLASARMQGFSEKDFPDFVQLVPMADAELIKLQHQGYAYLR